MVSDDNAGEAVVWWPCTLRKPSSKDGERDGGGTTTTTWELHYDAKAELGFASEIRVARLTGPGTLEDVAGSGEHDAEEDKNDDAPEIMTLRWRREGTADDDESPEHSDDDDDDDGDVADVNAVRVVDVLGMKPDADGSISLHAVHDAQRRADRTQISRGGEGLEDAGNRAFATMPMAQQQFMATKFMGFKEGLASALQELMRTNGPDYVITKVERERDGGGTKRGRQRRGGGREMRAINNLERMNIVQRNAHVVCSLIHLFFSVPLFLFF